MHLNIHYVYIYSQNGLPFENGVFPAVKKNCFICYLMFSYLNL